MMLPPALSLVESHVWVARSVSHTSFGRVSLHRTTRRYSDSALTRLIDSHLAAAMRIWSAWHRQSASSSARPIVNAWWRLPRIATASASMWSGHRSFWHSRTAGRCVRSPRGLASIVRCVWRWDWLKLGKRSVHSIRDSPAGNIPDRSHCSDHDPPIQWTAHRLGGKLPTFETLIRP
jgi:hypothetical protein